MSSPQIPQIKTPPPIQSPIPSQHVGSPSTLGPRTPGRPISPMSPLTTSSTPQHLRTPMSFESQTPNRDPSENPTHTSSRFNTHVHHTRTTSSSDNMSRRVLSPTAESHSSGGSYFSTTTGQSTCSYSSTELLTPPSFQADLDTPPYKPHHQSSSSLTMMTKTKRSKTIPAGKSHKGIKKKHRCHQKHGYRHHDKLRMCNGGCQVAPTAPSGMRELCADHVGTYRPLRFDRGTSDTYGRMMPRLDAEPLPPIVSRRWSSVEVGSHQIRLRSTLPKPVLSATATPIYRSQNRRAQPTERPYRSSTFTKGAIDHDIVRTVREKLTMRRLSPSGMETPAAFQIPVSITLRRASGTSGVSGISTVTNRTPNPGQESGEETPLAQPRSESGERRGTAFLITRKEIDSITELIEANLKRNYRSHNRVSAHTPSETPSTATVTQGTTSKRIFPARMPLTVKATPAPSFTTKGLVPHATLATQSVVTAAEIQSPGSSMISPRTVKKPAVDYLSLSSGTHLAPNSISRSPSHRINHEVIWEAGGSPSSATEDEERKESSSSSQRESHSATPRTIPVQKRPKTDSGDAFDPNNAAASINNWSWQLPETNFPVMVTSSDSESVVSRDESPPNEFPNIQPMHQRPPLRTTLSGTKTSRTQHLRTVRSVVTEAERSDVVSFPPLPRKSTNDWISPLPDIGVPPRPNSTPPQHDGQLPHGTPQRSPSSRSLYDVGIDATGSSASQGSANKSNWLSIKSGPPSPSFKFNPEFDIRRKSIIKSHPKAPARVGSHATIGSSIGSSSGERRKSSIKSNHSVHAKCVDNVNRPSTSRAGTWSTIRPPTPSARSTRRSVPKTPSPADESDEDLPSIAAPKRMRSGLVDRMSLIQDLSPPAPTPDHVGIYERITGARRERLSSCCVTARGRAHACSDDTRDPSIDWVG